MTACFALGLPLSRISAKYRRGLDFHQWHAAIHDTAETTPLKDFVAQVGRGSTDRNTPLAPAMSSAPYIASGFFDVANTADWFAVHGGMLCDWSSQFCQRLDFEPFKFIVDNAPVLGTQHVALPVSSPHINAPPFRALVARDIFMLPAHLASRPSTQYAPAEADSPNDRMALLWDAIKNVFPNAQITSESHVDPEEGWERLELLVRTQVANFDERFDREQHFYAAVRQDKSLVDALRKVSVVFE